MTLHAFSNLLLMLPDFFFHFRVRIKRVEERDIIICLLPGSLSSPTTFTHSSYALNKEVDSYSAQPSLPDLDCLTSSYP